MNEDGGAPDERHAEGTCDGTGGNGEEICDEPGGGAALADEILDARDGFLAEAGTVTLEPREERNDLVELPQAQPREPTEQIEIDERADERRQTAGKFERAECEDARSESDERRRAGNAVELEDRPCALSEDADHIGEVETGGNDRQKRAAARRDAGEWSSAEKGLGPEKPDSGGGQAQHPAPDAPILFRREHEHGEKAIADADRRESEPADDAGRDVEAEAVHDETIPREVIRPCKREREAYAQQHGQA